MLCIASRAAVTVFVQHIKLQYKFMSMNYLLSLKFRNVILLSQVMDKMKKYICEFELKNMDARRKLELYMNVF